MQIKEHKAKVFGKECLVQLMHFEDKDAKEWKRLFDSWKKLKLGLKKYKTREPNFPEGLSEVAFCLYSGSNRFISLKGNGINTSFDTYNLKTKKAEQIKACSVERDLTSFGPDSKWDDIYFLDFPSNSSIYSPNWPTSLKLVYTEAYLTYAILSRPLRVSITFFPITLD